MGDAEVDVVLEVDVVSNPELVGFSKEAPSDAARRS
jgi:hypothetical protein